MRGAGAPPSCWYLAMPMNDDNIYDCVLAYVDLTAEDFRPV